MDTRSTRGVFALVVLLGLTSAYQAVRVQRKERILDELLDEQSITVAPPIAALESDACPNGVSFVTDIEGDLEWFANIVSISKALEWDKDAPQRLVLKEGTCFVSGGDTLDRGPGDIRITRALVQLKEDYPYRVFLLVANRDLNKLRLASELSDLCLTMPANECTRALYNKEKGDADPRVNVLKDLVTRVKWILENTLSAGKSFEFRRTELEAISGKSSVSDQEVAESFRDEVLPPHGAVYRFLENAQLGIRIGETLFIPGSVAPESLLFVPSLALPYTDKHKNPEAVPGTYLPIETTTLDGWLTELNKFEREAVAEYGAKPIWDGPTKLFGGEALLCYQSPDCMVGRAVVTESLYNRGTVSGWGTSTHYGVNVADFLSGAGIKTFCTGGKPTGHMPLVTTVEGIVLIMADTSYSDDSFHEVLAKADGSFLVHGELRSGDSEIDGRYSFTNLDYDKGLIGKKKDGWWVQGKTDKGYHLFNQEGRKFSYKIADEAQVLSLLGIAPSRKRSRSEADLKADDFEDDEEDIPDTNDEDTRCCCKHGADGSAVECQLFQVSELFRSKNPLRRLAKVCTKRNGYHFWANKKHFDLGGVLPASCQKLQ